MKGEELEFRDVYLKWGVIERQKHLKKLCKELKIDYKDALLFGFFYVNKEGSLKFKIAGFIKKEKDELFFDEKIITQNISIRIEDYQFLKFDVINDKLEEYVNYADTVKLSCTYKKEDKMNLLKTREIKELDKYRDNLNPDNILVNLIINNIIEDIWLKLEGIYQDDFICKLLENSNNLKEYTKDSLVAVVFDEENNLVIKKLLKQ
jgi:hypothetical protein